MRGVLPAIVAIGLVGHPLLAQDSADSVMVGSPNPVTTAVARSWAESLTILPRPGAPLAGVALAIDGGAAMDRPGREGERWIFAQLLARTVAELGDGRVRLPSVEVRHDRIVVAFLVEPADVRSLVVDLESALSLAPSVRHFEEVRSGLLTTFAFEAQSPVVDMEAERRALLDGYGTPWSRPTRGTRISVESLSPSDIAAVASALTPDALHLAIVGAVDEATAPAGLRGARLLTPESDTAAADIQAPSGSGALAWETADRLDIAREVTNSWISVAFPVRDDLDPTLLDFLVHRMREEISTQPPDPWLFDADLRVARRSEGRVIVVDVSVLPEATDDWVRRVLETPATASARVQDDYFHWLRRRFRASVLLQEAAPEKAAARLALDALMGVTGIRHIGDQAWELSPDLLLESAGALGPARVMVYGPGVIRGR